MSKTELFIVVMAHVFAFYLAVGLLAITGGAVYLFGPETETYLSPVVVFGPTDGVTRDESKVCFTLHLTKVHAAVPLKYVFFIEAKLSERIPVAAYLVDDKDKKTAQDLKTHAVGTSWRRRYCFEMPATMPDDQEIRITGHAIHRRHPFWNTVTEIQPFNVAQLQRR